ncbi:MAG: ParB/RepB/Spo0J family partition protein [Treponema sp.]|nr:ParB/RepB/Spo0J family partition protein [Treponema sp.]
MAFKHGLGKGLDALLPIDGEGKFTADDPEGGSLQAAEEAADSGADKAAPGKDTGASGGGEIRIPLDKLRVNPTQPRRSFDGESLEELAASIREHGVIEPIIAQEAEDGSYIIIAGERRTRAARLAGLNEIPAVLRNYSDEKRMEVSLIENIQRQDLNPIEEASAYRGLMELTGLSQDEIAAKVGKNRSTVANALRLLKLPRSMQESLENGALSSGHARAVLSVNEPRKQESLYRDILANSISVREAEKRAARLNQAESAKPAADADKVPANVKARRAPELDAMEEKFLRALGTKVVIDGDLNKGMIHIEYYSMEDLERLYEVLGG